MWFAVVDTATGRLHTVTEEESSVNPDTTVWSWLALDRRPDFAVDDWDATTRTFLTRLPSVQGNRIDDILADGALPLGATVDKAGLRTVIEKYFSVEESRYTK